MTDAALILELEELRRLTSFWQSVGEKRPTD